MQTQVHNLSPQSPEDTEVVRWHLKVTDRVILQLATSVVRGDPIKSLVDLITNSNDSYRRIRSSNEASYGRIIVALDLRNNNITDSWIQWHPLNSSI